MPEKSKEIWLYCGLRLLSGDGKVCDSWCELDADGAAVLSKPHLFARGKGRNAHSFTVGGEYTATVTRESDAEMTLHGPPIYFGKHADDGVKARVAAAHQATRITIDRKALEAHDKRRNPLDDALNPLIELYRTVPYPQRDAFAAYVMRRMFSA